MKRADRGFAVLLIPGLLGLASCSDDAAETRAGAVPDPALVLPQTDYEGMEPPLAERLRLRTAAVEADPGSAEAWGQLGISYDVHGLFAEGIACYEQAQALDPDEFRWPYFLGISKMLGDREASLAHFERAGEIRSDHAPLFFYLGNGHLQLERLERARGDFERALEADPDQIAAHIGLGKVALAMAETDAALSHLEQAESLGPRTDEIHALLAEAHRRAGNTAEAERHAALNQGGLELESVQDPLREELLWRERVTLRWRRDRAEYYLAQGHAADAWREMEEAVGENPGSLEANLGLAHVLVRSGRIVDAEEAYRNALDIDPENSQALLGLANALSSGHHLNEAVVVLRQALQLNPDFHMSRNTLGTVLVQLGDVENGLELLRDSCDAMPDNADALMNWALAAKSVNHNPQAIEAFSRAVAADPKHARAHFELALMLAIDGRTDEALAGFREVTRIQPDHQPAWTNLHFGLTIQKRYSEAIDVSHAGLSALPDNKAILQQLLLLLTLCPDPALRNAAEARVLADRLLAQLTGDDPVAVHACAAAHAAAGEYERAIELIDRAIMEVERVNNDPRLPPSVRTKLSQEWQQERVQFSSGRAD